MISHEKVKEFLEKETNWIKNQGMTDQEKEVFGMRFKEYYKNDGR